MTSGLGDRDPEQLPYGDAAKWHVERLICEATGGPLQSVIHCNALTSWSSWNLEAVQAAAAALLISLQFVPAKLRHGGWLVDEVGDYKIIKQKFGVSPASH
jgi:hypothetical protein